MKRLSGKSAIITGAAQGMGANHARRFVAEGSNVVLTDLQEEAGASLAKELGESARFVHQDVTREEGWDTVVKVAEEAFRGIDILVNNASLFYLCPVDEAEPEMVRKLLDVNIYAYWLGIRKVVPSMKQAGGGNIINISSMAGALGAPSLGIYGTTKWAVRGLTKSAANDLASVGIRVNAVLPGTVANTGMFDASGGSTPEVLEKIPLKRTATLDDVSNLLVFLASDESSYITGADHMIDGGLGLF